MNTTPLTEAAELAQAVVHDLASGRWEQVTERVDPAMRESLSEDSLAAAWAQIVGTSGAYEGQGAPVVARAGDVTVTNTPLSMEAGDYTARIAFRDDRTIVGPCTSCRGRHRADRCDQRSAREGVLGIAEQSDSFRYSEAGVQDTGSSSRPVPSRRTAA